jgi:hypothetical protein
MSGSPSRLSVPLITTALALILVAVAAELLAVGFNEDAVHLALRTTARTSAILFALAVAAPAIRWLRPREGSLLVSFAGSHLIHLAVPACRIHAHARRGDCGACGGSFRLEARDHDATLRARSARHQILRPRRRADAASA